MQVKTAAEAAELINSRVMQGEMSAKQITQAAAIIERYTAAVLYTGQAEPEAEQPEAGQSRAAAAKLLRWAGQHKAAAELL